MQKNKLQNHISNGSSLPLLIMCCLCGQKISPQVDINIVHKNKRTKMANFHISDFRVFFTWEFSLIFSWWQFPETHPTERVKHHGHRWCPMISFLKWKPSAVSKVQSKYFQTRLKNVWLFRSLYYLPLAWLCLLWNFKACLSPYLTRPPWATICLEGGSCLFPKELSK